METKKNIATELFNDIKRIMALDINKKSFEDFQNITKDLLTDDCKVKSGWVAGKYISFTCNFRKGGTGVPFDEFINGIENKEETHGFINGLNPTIFSFSKKLVVNDSKNLILSFRLKVNE